MPTPAETAYATHPATIPYERVGFGWGAVLAGLGIAIALDVFFAEIGLWMNLGIIDRQTSGEAIVTLNAIAWVLSGLVALFGGAWVAGRMASARTRTEGGLHGLAVWAAGAVAMLTLAIGAAGVFGTGMLSVVGKGVEGAGQVAAVALPNWDGIKEELQGAMDQRDSGGARTSAGAGSAAADDTRLLERSRLFELAGNHFTLESGAAASGEREEFVELLSAQLGLSKPVAERTLAQWDEVWAGTVQKYEAAKAEALRVAEAARVVAMAAAGWAALAMLLGAAAALAGGAYGATCRLRLSGTQGVLHSEVLPVTPLPYSGRGQSGQPYPVG
jgi:hypothetical protein